MKDEGNAPLASRLSPLAFHAQCATPAAAEPGSLVGFLGPRVYEHLYGEPFPSGIQTAENLHRHGVIDGVVPLDALRSTLDRTLKVVSDPAESPPPLPKADELVDWTPTIQSWVYDMAKGSPE